MVPSNNEFNHSAVVDISCLTIIIRIRVFFQAIENIIVDKVERSHFLSSIILSDIESESDGSIFRVNMTAYLNNPELMESVPTLDNAVFQGEALFINGDRSQYVSRDHTKTILKVKLYLHI